MIDVAFLTTALERGGAETQMVRIAATLRQRGWRVGILTLMPSGAFREEVAAAAIPWVELPDARARLPWRSAVALARQLRRWRPAVLVTFNFPADVFGRLCGVAAGVPAVVAAMGTTRIRTALRRGFYRWSEPLVAMSVSNSKAAAASFTAAGILRPDKTMVIANGMDLAAFADPPEPGPIRAELGAAADQFLWLAVGNLRPAKDYANLLDAAALCAGRGRPFRLGIVGAVQDPAHAEGLRRLAGELRLEPRVAFLGGRTDVPRLLAAADGFVLSSAWEGMPNTVQEAMAAGLPVVATDVGDVRELVEDDRTGYLAPPGDCEALADRMLTVMDLSPERRRSMGERARRRIEAEFENGQIVDRWERLLRRLIAVRAPKRQPPPRIPAGENVQQVE